MDSKKSSTRKRRHDDDDENMANLHPFRKMNAFRAFDRDADDTDDDDLELDATTTKVADKEDDVFVLDAVTNKMINKVLLAYRRQHLQADGVIHGRGLMKKTAPETIQRYVRHARRVLTLVASQSTFTEESAMKAVLVAETIDVIESSCLTGGDPGWHLTQLTHFETFLKYIGERLGSNVDANLRTVAKARMAANHRLKVKEGKFADQRTYAPHAHLFNAAFADAGGSMGGNPNGIDNALPKLDKQGPPLPARLEVRASVHAQVAPILEVTPNQDHSP